MQLQTLPDVNSIDIQMEIQWFMRPYLLDFMVEAHAAFALLPDTLYLAVNLLDRYCSKRVVYKRHYQLVGCAALLIAAKYGDRKDRVPQIKELKAMCCGLYEEEMFVQMEWHLLQTLDWVIGHPTVDAFIQVALSDTYYDSEVEHMAWYISELAMYHKEFVSVLPSMIAHASLALARCILSRPAENEDYDDPLVARLFAQLQEPSSVVSKKYVAYQLSYSSVTARNFVERELVRQRQMVAVTPPVDTGLWADTKYGPQGSLHPHTPQKMQYAPIMNHGLYTPPITPENENAHNAAAAYAKYQQGLRPTTPTPPCSVEQHPLRQCNVNYTEQPPQGYYLS